MRMDDLRRWMEENNIKERTLKSFWVCLDNYLQEKEEVERYFGKFEKRSLEAIFYKIEAKIVNYDEIGLADADREFIEAYLKLKYKNRGIGYYSLLFDFEGKTFDDFFTLYYKEWSVYQEIDVLDELRDYFNSGKLKDKYSQDVIDEINSAIEEKIERNKKIAVYTLVNKGASAMRNDVKLWLKKSDYKNIVQFKRTVNDWRECRKFYVLDFM